MSSHSCSVLPHLRMLFSAGSLGHQQLCMQLVSSMHTKLSLTSEPKGPATHMIGNSNCSAVKVMQNPHRYELKLQSMQAFASSRLRLQSRFRMMPQPAASRGCTHPKSLLTAAIWLPNDPTITQVWVTGSIDRNLGIIKAVAVEQVESHAVASSKLGLQALRALPISS